MRTRNLNFVTGYIKFQNLFGHVGLVHGIPLFNQSNIN